MKKVLANFEGVIFPYIGRVCGVIGGIIGNVISFIDAEKSCISVSKRAEMALRIVYDVFKRRKWQLERN